MKKFIGIAFVAIMLLSVGCARLMDGFKAKGGIITSHYAPYIVISQSGGLIMDVYKLRRAIVQSPSYSDGWLFVTDDGTPIFVGGDVKTLRLKSASGELWDKYHEYHMEFESMTYRELYHPQGNVVVP